MNSGYWWSTPLKKDEPNPDNHVHHLLYDKVRQTEQNQHEIHRLNLFNAKIYSNRDLMAMDWNTRSHKHHSHGPASYVIENLIGNVVDSVTALIGRNKPKVTPVVRDADFSIEKAARQLDRFLWAEFNHQDIYKKMQRCFNDSLWAQIGVLRIDINSDNEVYTERVMPDEIIVDQRECVANTTPMQIHQRRLISKVELASRFPDQKDEIFGIKNAKWTSQRGPDEEHLVIIESWFLGQKGIPGRHVICTEGITFVDEVYKRKRFPFIFLRWTQLPTGFYAKSLVEELTPYQMRHNELNRVIKIAQDLMCVPRIFVEGNSRIQKMQLDNEICRILSYRGTKPEVMTWPAAATELYNERDRNKANAFEFAGISQMFAQAKPADGMRFDSSKAMREFNFRENERFAPQAQALEMAYLEAGEHYIELNAILAKEGRGRKLKWRDRRLVDNINWDDVNLDREKYVLELQASSVMNMTPAAREDQLKDWQGSGRIDVQQMNGLSGNPDLEEEESLMRASIDDMKATVEELDNGEFPQPDPLQNLVFGIPFVHKVYLKRRRQEGVPEEILQNYMDWIVEAKAILEQEDATSNQQTFQPMNMGPEGQMMPSIATTAQGTPVEALM